MAPLRYLPTGRADIGSASQTRSSSLPTATAVIKSAVHATYSPIPSWLPYVGIPVLVAVLILVAYAMYKENVAKGRPFSELRGTIAETNTLQKPLPAPPSPW